MNIAVLEKIYFTKRSIVYLLLSTGLLREEVILLNLNQVELHMPEALRMVCKAKYQ